MLTPDEASERRILELHDLAARYAKAKAELEYIREFRKVKKSLLMADAEQAGIRSTTAQERDAYRNPEYAAFLEGLREAVETEAKLNWELEIVKMRWETWRTKQATKRAEMNFR